MKYRAYWQGEDGIRNVIPQRKGNRFPEGFSVLGWLASRYHMWDVVEIGCGYGRLAPAFKPTKYIGLDPNEEAIRKAKSDNPDHLFGVIDGYRYPTSEMKLLWTVLMHIPDDEYDECLDALTATTTKRIVISEIMDPTKRRELEKKKEGWIHPTFGRSPQQHIDAFSARGWKMQKQNVWGYPGKGLLTALEFQPDV